MIMIRVRRHRDGVTDSPTVLPVPELKGELVDDTTVLQYLFRVTVRLSGIFDKMILNSCSAGPDNLMSVDSPECKSLGCHAYVE